MDAPGKCLQFEIWSECDNTCSFCYLQRHDEAPDSKINKLNYIEDYIKNNDISIYKSIGFMGGEIYGGQLNGLKDRWLDLMSFVNKVPTIDYVWLNTAMMFESTDDLEDTIKVLSDKRIYLCTSWDANGRFNKPGSEAVWEKNLYTIIDKYKNKNVIINVTSIITQSLIEYYQSSHPKWISDVDIYNLFRPQANLCGNKLASLDHQVLEAKADFSKKLPYFFPKRSDYLDFCYNYISNYGSRPFISLVDNTNHSHSVIGMYAESSEILIDRFNSDMISMNKCGHEYVASCYIDSNKCMLCDTINVLKKVYGSSYELHFRK